MKLLTWILTGLLCVFLLSQCLTSKSPEINVPMPTFRLPKVNNLQEYFTNTDLPSTLSIIHFWASWCPACRADHPMLMEIKNHYHVPIYSILYNDLPKNANAWLEKAGNPYVLSSLDVDNKFATQLDVEGVPTTLILNQGIILYRFTGALTSDDLKNTLLPLIKKYTNTV